MARMKILTSHEEAEFELPPKFNSVERKRFFVISAETAIFQRYAAAIWTDAERCQFIDWIANNPLAGDIIQGSGGCRKVRWSRSGMGKRGGARIIYFNGTEGRVWLLIVYTKTKFDNLPTEFLAKLKQEVEHG